jgi:hypothetical protein
MNRIPVAGGNLMALQQIWARVEGGITSVGATLPKKPATLRPPTFLISDF